MTRIICTPSASYDLRVTARVSNGTVPIFVSAAVANATPTKVVLTYDQTLDTGSVPATTDFTVTDHTVSSVAIVGATVELTLSVQIYPFDVIYVTYTKGANPIKGDVGGLEADNLASTLVTNNVTDWTAYWATRYPSNLSLVINSDTQITPSWINNGDQDYDDISIERSTDGVNYSEITTAVVGATSKADLTCLEFTKYYYRIRYRKGTHYSNYSNIAYDTTKHFFETDGNSVWYDAGDLTTITKDGSNLVSKWADKLGSGNDLIQANAARQPIWTTPHSIVFNGVSGGHNLRKVFTLNQPANFYIVFKYITFTHQDVILSGTSAGLFRQYSAAPQLRAGVTLEGSNTDLALNTFGIARVFFNGATSKIQIDNNAAVNFDAGATTALGGISLGARADGTANNSNIQICEIIVRRITDTAPHDTSIYNYLSNKYSLLSGDTFAWFDSEDLSTITKDGSNVVSRWNDKLGSGHDLVNGSCVWDATDGMTFNGVDEYLSTNAATLNQPITIYAIIRQKTFTDLDPLISGLSGTALVQYGGQPSIRANAGTYSGYNTGLLLNSWGIVRLIYDGASSKLITNDGIPVTGDFGSDNAGGIIIGANAALNKFSNCYIKELIVRKVIDTEVQENEMFAYLRAKLETYRFDNGKLVISFDGNLKSIYTGAFPILVSKNVKATHFTVGNSFGGSFISLAELKDMYDNNIDIQCHTYTHTKLNELSDLEIHNELDAVDAVLVGVGIPAANHTAYPFGTVPINNEAILFSGYRQSTRGVLENVIEYKTVYRFQLPAINIDDGVASGIKAILDEVALRKKAVIVYTHGIGIEGIETEDLEEIINYAIGLGIDIITMSELYALLIDT
ncbi:MAG: polysaccharide deacetylase family protein [Bacteroidales bacterium]|nr:polysaccharide deacetylase family protein [Bacteroidales bacterium]